MREGLKTVLTVAVTIAVLYGGLWSWQYIRALHEVVRKLDEQTTQLVEQNKTMSQALAQQCSEILGAQGYTVGPPPPEE
jgi:hypothetical protein